MQIYFVKSLEEDFATKTLKGKKKVVCQTVKEIVRTKTIKPNTKSFGRELRLACSILHKNYLKTYRPQGIIFQTADKPKYIFPFDLVVLSATNKIIVQYYRIRKNLWAYYGNQLINGFERFIFKNFNEMVKIIFSPAIAWKRVNVFRKSHGYNALKKQKYKLVEYNEAIFNKPIRIKPIAVYGYRKETRKIAKRLGLPAFTSAKQFYLKQAAKLK